MSSSNTKSTTLIFLGGKYSSDLVFLPSCHSAILLDCLLDGLLDGLLDLWLGMDIFEDVYVISKLLFEYTLRFSSGSFSGGKEKYVENVLEWGALFWYIEDADELLEKSSLFSLNDEDADVGFSCTFVFDACPDRS